MLRGRAKKRPKGTKRRGMGMKGIYYSLGFGNLNRKRAIIMRGTLMVGCQLARYDDNGRNETASPLYIYFLFPQDDYFPPLAAEISQLRGLRWTLVFVPLSGR